MSRRSRVRILWKPWLLPSSCFNWKVFCDDHSSLSSTTAVQYEFHRYFSSALVPLNKSYPMLPFRIITFTLTFLPFLRYNSNTSLRWLLLLSTDHTSCHTQLPYVMLASMLKFHGKKCIKGLHQKQHNQETDKTAWFHGW